MSTEIIAVIINIVATILPKMGIQIGSAELTTAVNVVLTLATGIYLWYKRYQRGGVNVAGVRTQ